MSKNYAAQTFEWPITLSIFRCVTSLSARYTENIFITSV